MPKSSEHFPVYHKIYGAFNRDAEKGSPTRGQLIEGDWKKEEFGALKDVPWLWYEKVDGTNVRVCWDGHDVEFRGRTNRAEMHPDLVSNLSDTFTEEILEQVYGSTPVVLYGEGYGAGIQKGGGKYRQEKGFILFDVKIGDWWIRKEDVAGMAEALGVDMVPSFGEKTLAEAIEDVKAGVKSQLKDDYAEGYVGNPKGEFLDRAGRRIIVKVKHKDFFERDLC